MPRVNHRRRHRMWAAMTIGTVANGLRLRARLSHLPVLDPGLAACAPVTNPDEFRLVTGAGVVVEDRTLRAAVAHARAQQLDVLDLVPVDLPVGPLFELLRLVNPKTYRHDRLAAGRGAGHATLVRASLLERLGRDRLHDLDPVEHLELLTELKRFAPTSTDLVVAPDLRAVDPDAGWRYPYLQALFGGAAPAFAGIPLLSAVVVSIAPKLGRRWGTVAMATYAAQPFLVTARSPVRPRDLRPWSAIGRPGRELAAGLRALLAPPPAAAQARADQADDEETERRRIYAKLLAQSSRFFEPRRETCPWCGGGEIELRVVVPDLLQGKPGSFRLDECRACGHVFQNPRLSPEGLDFYYRDFYDGLQSEQAEFVFSTGGRSYRARAAMLEGVATPKRWLDVGAGHGHFCLVAREAWPETRFDGLDMSESIREAERRGWIEQGHQGLLVDLAADLTGAYDVVSMHHCLEHTRDPRAELDAAHTVLEAGGHLLIEVPDPESRLGRWLGWLWGPWFQPQHQHFLPLGNLVAALEERGFTIVAAERGPAHQPVDLVFALWLLANRIAPAGARPWDPPPTLTRRFLRSATFAAFVPFLLAALATDLALAPLVRRLPRMSNTYRVLARKEGEA